MFQKEFTYSSIENDESEKEKRYKILKVRRIFAITWAVGCRNSDCRNINYLWHLVAEKGGAAPSRNHENAIVF